MSSETEHLIQQVLADCQIELAQTGITLGRQLGCGDYGCAFDAGQDRVLKITVHKKEADAAHWILSNEVHPSYPKVYGVWEWNCHGEKPVYVILREDLDDLSDIDLEWFGSVTIEFESRLYGDAVEKKNLTEDGINNTILEIFEEIPGSPEDENTFYEQLRDLYVWNANNGVWLDDIIISNWGQKKDGTITIRDLGAIKLLP